MQQSNSTPSDADVTDTLIRKLISLTNGSVAVIFNSSLDYEEDWRSEEQRNGDRFRVFVFIGVFLSVCALISLLVLLFVFFYHRTILWPLWRGRASPSGPDMTDDKDKDYAPSNAEAAAEEGRAGPPAEQEGLLTASDDSKPDKQQASQSQSITSSSDSDSDGRPKAP